ncbi:wound-responsive family protein [Tanacetum coccineum]
MSSKTRSLIVAGTVGLVEALKDQGFARWNYTIRTIHHHAKSNIRSVTQSKKLSKEESRLCKWIYSINLHLPANPNNRSVLSPKKLSSSAAMLQAKHRSIRRVIDKSHVNFSVAWGPN